MGRNAKRAVKENRSMMIFPQGTRVNPGVSSREKPYLPGVFFSLYADQGSCNPSLPIMQDCFGQKIVL